jgi:hypothetical protein
MSLELIFLINGSTSIFLCGLIWVIQLVHYPSFHFVEESRFIEFQAFHTRRIDYIVMPLMSIELGTSAAMWWFSNYMELTSFGFYVVLLIWIATGLFSVPNHNKLEKAKDTAAIQALVNTNWIRTILWTMKAALSVLILISN